MNLATSSFIVALLSMCVATTTAWLTLWQRGTVKMVRPSLIAFQDAGGTDGPKVSVRKVNEESDEP